MQQQRLRLTSVGKPIGVAVGLASAIVWTLGAAACGPATRIAAAPQRTSATGPTDATRGATDASGGATDAARPLPPGVELLREFVYERSPFLSVHASTLTEIPGGLLAAFFGGTGEGNPDVGIWVSRYDGRQWSPPVEAFDGRQPDGKRFPCWNPVLVTLADGNVALFYKVGPNPRAWWGMLALSADGGKQWGAPRRLPEGILGPVKNKPISLPDGRLLCGSSTEDGGWTVHMEVATPGITADRWTFSRTPNLSNPKAVGLIQPTVLQPADRLLALCRSHGEGHVFAIESADGGDTWSKPEPLELPNPNSGIDGVTMADGRSLLVYNHTAKGRSPLNIAISQDGRSWGAPMALESEPGEFSYPAVIQTADGLVHITYTWKRHRVRHVVLDLAKLRPPS